MLGPAAVSLKSYSFPQIRPKSVLLFHMKFNTAPTPRDIFWKQMYNLTRAPQADTKVVITLKFLHAGNDEANHNADAVVITIPGPFSIDKQKS